MNRLNCENGCLSIGRKRSNELHRGVMELRAKFRRRERVDGSQDQDQSIVGRVALVRAVRTMLIKVVRCF